MIKKVTRASDDKVLYKAQAQDQPGAARGHLASDVSYAMQQIVQSGTGQNALALGRPAAGKTGTATNDDGDVSSSWFVGYTPQISTAVMYVRGAATRRSTATCPASSAETTPPTPGRRS